MTTTSTKELFQMSSSLQSVTTTLRDLAGFRPLSSSPFAAKYTADESHHSKKTLDYAYCQQSRRGLRAWVSAAPLSTTFLQIIKPITPLQAKVVFSLAYLATAPQQPTGVFVYTTYPLLAFEDPLPSEMQWPTLHRREPHQASQNATTRRLTHPFVRDLHTDLDGLQPTRRMASLARSPPTAHLRTGACSGDRASQTSTEAPAASNSLSCWEEQRQWHFQDTAMIIEAPMSDYLVCSC